MCKQGMQVDYTIMTQPINQALKLKQCFDIVTATRVRTAEVFYTQSAIESTGVFYCPAT